MTQKIVSSSTFQYLCLTHAKIGLIFARPWKKILREEQQVPVTHLSAKEGATSVVTLFLPIQYIHISRILALCQKLVEESGSTSIDSSVASMAFRKLPLPAGRLSALCPTWCPLQWVIQDTGTCHLPLAFAVEGSCSNYFAHWMANSLIFVGVCLTTRNTAELFKWYGRRAFAEGAW